MIVNYKLPDVTQYSSTVKYAFRLKISGRPVFFLQDVLYEEKDLLEVAVPHLLGVT